jgi:Fur family transcriptional regulator, peroxide stress response regulator
MKNDGGQDETHVILQMFQQHQLKITPQRVAIYQKLLNSSTHPTADAIYQIVKKEYPHISFDTVNRTLLTFAKIGIVEVVEVFGGAKRFDPNVDGHHHLHCTQCGEITDFEHRAYDDLDVPEDIRKTFKVLRKRVVLRGICNACRS